MRLELQSLLLSETTGVFPQLPTKTAELYPFLLFHINGKTSHSSDYSASFVFSFLKHLDSSVQFCTSCLHMFLYANLWNFLYSISDYIQVKVEIVIPVMNLESQMEYTDAMGMNILE